MRLVGSERLEMPVGGRGQAFAGDAVDALIAQAAAAVVWRTDPYVLASQTYGYDPSEAERLSQMILRRQPAGSAAALSAINLLGLIRQDVGDLDGAEAQYRHAIEIDSNFAVAHMNLGNVQHERGDFDAAIASQRRAIALDPNYARAYANLGRTLYSKGERALAVASYRRALELDPRLAILHSNLCVALIDTDLPHATSACRRAVELDPGYAAGHFNLGLALAQKGDLDGAVAAYRRAIDLSPEHSRVRDAAASALVGLTGPRG
jgi:tetratricopeptide (TPR) repeat protein